MIDIVNAVMNGITSLLWLTMLVVYLVDKERVRPYFIAASFVYCSGSFASNAIEILTK